MTNARIPWQLQDFVAPAGALPPLLVKIHGGPTSQASTAFNLGVQYWTSRGFAVADVNYGERVRPQRAGCGGMHALKDLSTCGGRAGCWGCSAGPAGASRRPMPAMMRRCLVLCASAASVACTAWHARPLPSVCGVRGSKPLLCMLCCARCALCPRGPPLPAWGSAVASSWVCQT